MTWLQQLRSRILTILDQIFMIFNIPTFTSDLEGRLRRLRRIYYNNPKATISHGQVRDILHGHVDKPYREYYERLLSVERIIYASLQRLPDTITYQDMLTQAQRLGDRMAAIVDEIQLLERQQQRMQAVDPSLGEQLATQVALLREELERGFVQQMEIPAAIQRVTSSRSTRETERLTEQINNLTAHFDDIAASYEELDDDPIARALRNTTDED